MHGYNNMSGGVIKGLMIVLQVKEGETGPAVSPFEKNPKTPFNLRQAVYTKLLLHWRY